LSGLLTLFLQQLADGHTRLVTRRTASQARQEKFHHLANLSR
jgi:hypothetical protein